MGPELPGEGHKVAALITGRFRQRRGGSLSVLYVCAGRVWKRGVVKDSSHAFTILTGKCWKRSWPVREKDKEFDLGPAEFLALVDHLARDIQVRQSEGAAVELWVWSEKVAAEELRRKALPKEGER